jgi:glucosyl-dolichyl phosphate glucuronosyltransferase
MATSEPKTTVLVCTRNRGVLFERVCLELLQQSRSARGWELLIVDNGSTDDTPDLARRIERERPDIVRVVREPAVGLSVARNRGIREARGVHILFLDDDAFPEPGWLDAMTAALSRDGVVCAGGPVQPLIQGELPDWFLGRYMPYLTAWDLGKTRVNLTYNEYPRGANMGFRKQAFEIVGVFADSLGRKGASLMSCEEIELCLRIERVGCGDIVYEPAAGVRHVTAAGRLTPEWMRQRFAAQGRSEAVIYWQHGGWSALATGLLSRRRQWREADRAPGGAERLLARFKRREYRSYAASTLSAPFRFSRWAPPEGPAPEAWSPPF